jgi:catechol 2,3-dioxygenase-like lactoylglutathione lyase family enzyme
MLNRVHHIAFVVRDLDAAIAHYEQLFERAVQERGPVKARGAEVAIFRLDNLFVEFIAPTDPNGSLQRYLDTRGEGFFHLAFATPDLESALVRLDEMGVQTEPIVNNYSDWRIAYLETQATPAMRAHLVDKSV